MDRSYGKRSAAVFFIAVICLSAAAELLICKYQILWAYPVLMWMPAVAAVIASVAAIKETGNAFSIKRLLVNTGFRFCKIRYILAGVLLPLVYLLLPYMLYWQLHPENFAYSGVPLTLILQDCLLPGVIGIFLGLFTAAGEEIGWRGFLVPALCERIGWKKTLLVTGLFWCLWHFPLLIWGGYAEGQPLLYALPAFVLCIFPVGVICGILSLKSGSMWPCAFLHAAHNNYDQSVLGVITKGEDKLYYVSETGIFTMIVVWLIAVFMFIRFKRKEERK